MEISQSKRNNSKMDKPTPKATSCRKSEDLTIFVGGLPSKCTSKDLQSYFQKFGKIISCEPQTWKKGGKKCRGFALVHCANRQTQKKILSKKKHLFNGRNIECKKWFSSKEKLDQYSKELKRRKLFVGGLPPKWKSKDLENFFSRFGALDIAYVITNPKTGRSKGFGYIVFERLADRNKVVKMKDFKTGGKLLSVSEYTDKDTAKEKKKKARRVKLRQSSKTFEVKDLEKRVKKRGAGGFKIKGSFSLVKDNASFSEFSTDSGGNSVADASPLGMKNVLKVLDIYNDGNNSIGTLNEDSKKSGVASKLKIFVSEDSKNVELKRNQQDKYREPIFNFGNSENKIFQNRQKNQESRGEKSRGFYSLFGGFEGKRLSKKFNFSQ